MRKVFYYFAVLAFAGCTLTACSDSDDGNFDDGTASTEFFVPASIVDGTRVQSVGGLNATYNEDGSIAKLENNGTTYNFEYGNGTRAAVSTGRQIKRIYANVNGAICEGTNFKFNSYGFLTAMTFHSRTIDGSNYTEELNLNYALSYDGTGHLTSNKITGNVKWNEDGESGDENVNTTVNFTWENGNLTSSSASTNVASVNTTLDYGTEANTFNLTTPAMAGVIGFMSDDPILTALSMLGFTGNSSAMLPVKLVCKITDEDGTDTDVSNFTYTFNPDHSVDIINVTDGYGSTYNFKYVYYKK